MLPEDTARVLVYPMTWESEAVLVQGFLSSSQADYPDTSPISVPPSGDVF